MTAVKKYIIPTICLAGATALAIVIFLHPLSSAAITPNGITITGWSSYTMYLLYWPIFAVLAAATFFVWRSCFRYTWHSDRTRAVFSSLQPILLWPCLMYLSSSAAWLGTSVASIFPSYGTIFIFTLIIFRFYEKSGLIFTNFSIKNSRIIFFAVICAAYFSTIAALVPFVSKYYSGGGDVCHYTIQTENLIKRGNLDLTDAMNEMMANDRIPLSGHANFIKKSHMKINADGRIYSYHSYGFPILMAIIRGDTSFSRIIFYALITLLASVGCYMTAREIGTPRRESFITTAMMSMSFMWIFHGISFLPEMTGIALTAWAFWAIPAQNHPRKRLAATLVSAIACSYLPFAHIRFLPLAAMLFGFFGIEGLIQTDEHFWKRRGPRLFAYTLICLAAWFILYHSHSIMFSAQPRTSPQVETSASTLNREPIPQTVTHQPTAQGKAYNYKGIIMGCPLAMWGVFADEYGFVSLCPLVWWLILAPILTLLPNRHDTRQNTSDDEPQIQGCNNQPSPRRWATASLLTTAAVLVTCCSTDATFDGTCLRGRYFVQTIPLLLPFAAYALSKTGRAARFWFFFLAVIQVVFCIYTIGTYHSTSIVQAPYTLWTSPQFSNLWQPLPASFIRKVTTPRVYGHLFAGGMLLFTFSLFFFKNTKKRIVTACLVFASAIAAGFASNSINRSDFKKSFEIFCKHGAYGYYTANCATNTDYFTALLGSSASNGKPSLMLSSSPQPEGCKIRFLTAGGARDSMKMKNGETGNWYKTRATPVELQAGGEALIKIRGRVIDGQARAVVAKINGRSDGTPISLEQGNFEEIFKISPALEHGYYNIYLSLENDTGTVVVDDFIFVPYLPGLEKALGSTIQ